MTQPTPPQQPAQNNPYAAAPGVPPQGAPQGPPQGAPYGAPEGAPQAYPGHPGGGPGAPAYTSPAIPALPSGGKLALGAVAALVTGLVAAVIYGLIMGKAEVEVGYAAVGVGALVGLVSGKVAGGNPVTAIIGAIVSLGAVYLGQLIGYSVSAADQTTLLGANFFEVLTGHFDIIQQVWSEELDLLTIAFIAFGGFAAFSVAKKVGQD
ncbi:hypothetical protein [Streptomyces fragilis]|uniref:Integral membrane protein n=1 Tax=Streptomyces fragilis TaxID=67301 RepID=A0ABV2YJU4_9ACTN|nr:hypothetical protein [Streptomyces fragilis]